MILVNTLSAWLMLGFTACFVGTAMYISVVLFETRKCHGCFKAEVAKSAFAWKLFVLIFWGFFTVIWALPNNQYNVVYSQASKAVLVASDDQTIVEVFPNGKAFFCWEPSVWKNSLYSYEVQAKTIHMTFHPITPNPKVRDFSYDVTVQTDGTIEGFRTLCALQKANEFDKVVQYHCYEFQERHSQILSQLYNPLDDRQQRAFAQLIQPYLTAHLPSCLTVTEVRFVDGQQIPRGHDPRHRN